MLSLKQNVWKIIGGISLSYLVASPAFAQLSPAEINSIARQTTVLIAPGLTPELITEIENNRNNPLAKNKAGVWNTGSGVIIAKKGKTYYVLTVAHNFAQRFVDENRAFGIRTWDRQVHVVTQINDRRGCPLNGTGVPAAIVRFGCRPSAYEVFGTDLALVSFESEKNYPVAPIGDSDRVNKGDILYISGWPDPEKELVPGTNTCRGRVARRVRRLAWGPVTGKIDPNPENLGYSIFYIDNTRPGMSGGPVFDVYGRVVGSHGRGSQQKKDCAGIIESTIKPESEFGILNDQYSTSQQVNIFQTLIHRMGMILPFNLKPPSADLIKPGLTAVQVATGRTGILDIDTSRDTSGGSFEDPNDFVDDIYKEYSGFAGLGSRVRDNPSGGCEFMQLGDRCEE